MRNLCSTGRKVAAYAFPVERVAIFCGAALLEEKFSGWTKDEKVNGAVEQVIAVDDVAALGANFVVVFVDNGEEFGGISKVCRQHDI